MKRERRNYTRVSTIVYNKSKTMAAQKKQSAQIEMNRQSFFSLFNLTSYVNKYINFWGEIAQGISSSSHTSTPREQRLLLISSFFFFVLFDIVFFFVFVLSCSVHVVAAAIIFHKIVSLDSSSCPSKVSSFVVCAPCVLRARKLAWRMRRPWELD